MTMDFLQRLRKLQLEQCCLHIDQQIGLWYQHTTATATPTSTTATTTTTATATPTATTTTIASPPTTTMATTLTTISETTTITIPTADHTTTTTLVTPTETTATTTTETPITPTAPTLSTTEITTTSPSITAVSPSITISSPTIKVEPPTIKTEYSIIKTEPSTLTTATPTILTTTPIIVTTTPTIVTTIATPTTTTKTIITDNNSNTTTTSCDLFVNEPITPSPQPSSQQSAPPLSPVIYKPLMHEEDDITIGCFLSNIKHLESFDSDATESTSSNDSYDELEGFSHEDIPPKRKSFHPSLTQTRHPTTSASFTLSNNVNQDYSDLKKKAIWKWANERSRLASRWTWLQAQIADLEFRIRGQNDATMHARAHKTPPIPPVLPEISCSRTVPLSKDFRRRRLIKSTQILSDSNRKLVKFSHVPCICSSLPQTVAPCLSCNGRYNYLRRLEGEKMPLSERISLLDPCSHPVLSFPDDLTLGSQLSYLLKHETINRKPTKGRPGRKKGSTAEKLAAAAAAAAAAAEASGVPPKHTGKFYRGMVGRPPLKNPSQTMITSNKLRRKYRKHSTNNNNWTGTRRNKRRASSVNESSESSSNNNVARRRRSEQSAYDIDNIVIPFSIAATTRVEILEYKEIMTPSWRVWENGTCQSVDEEIEDTSDEAYIVRHSKGEIEEKKRFALKAVPTDSK